MYLVRLRETGQVITHDELRAMHPNSMGMRAKVLTEQIINDHGADVVFEGPQATGGTHYQYSQYSGVEQQADGKWYTKYILGPIFTDRIDRPLNPDGSFGEEYTVTAEQQWAEYTARRDAEQSSSVRQSRDNKLKETDWLVIRAIETNTPLDAEWATYRQALRDITAQEGFPWDVTWPVQPE